MTPTPNDSAPWRHSSQGAPLLYVADRRGRGLASAPPFDRRVEDLELSVEWLQQAIAPLDADAHGDAVRSVEALAEELDALVVAARRVARHAAEPVAARLFAPATALAAYLDELATWVDRLASTLEDIAASLRRAEAPRGIFALGRLTDAHARLDALARAAQQVAARLGARTLDADLEELLWATSWIHLTLTRRFGA